LSQGVCLTATLLNEAEHLPEFLDSLLAQTRRPQQIVLVDGGSKDDSRKIIRRYIAKGAPIELVKKPGANRSLGRNTAVRRSAQPIIAMCDVGCRLAPDWLDKIVAPIERGEAEVVSGYYAPEAKTLMARAIAAATVPTAAEVNPKTFLPSSRSVAFLKSAWEKCEGYPEWNSDGEDTLFDLALKKSGARFYFAPEALVYWQQRGSLKELYRQFYRYALSDGQAGLFFPHYRKAMALLGWTLVLLVFSLLTRGLLPWISLGLLVLTWGGYKIRYILRSRRRGWDWGAALFSPLAMLVCDAANYSGFRAGSRMPRK
jgi:glycosyltransferase involved in cell wall biosynthesis